MLFCFCACVWCVVKLGTLSLSALSPSSSLFLSLSHYFSLLSSFFSLLFLFLFLLLLLLLLLLFFLFFFSLSSLLATKHYGKNRSTNTAANIEAFECDLAQGKCTAIGSLPPPLSPPSSLLPLPSSKKEETSYYRNISGEESIFITVLN